MLRNTSTKPAVMAASFQWPVLLTAIACGLLTATQAQNMSPRCTSSQRRAVPVSSSLTLQCDVPSSDVTITWFSKLTGSEDKEREEGSCPPLPANCTSSGTSVVTRPGPTRSEMRFTSPGQRDHSVDVTCRTNSANTVITYIVDLIQGSVNPGACKARFLAGSRDDWQVEGDCTMSSIFSADSCYGCEWFEIRDGGLRQKLLEQYKTVNVVSNYDGTVNMICGFNKPIPTAGGRYTYSARILTTAGEVPANDVLIVEAPSRPTHDCPDFVAEGAPLSCTCTACKSGTPPGTPQWEATRQTTLQVPNVQRDSDGTIYRCRMQLGQPVEYKLRVAYGPDDAYIGIIDSGTSFSLICVPVNVNPTPSFEWRIRGTDVILYDRQVLEEVQASDFEEGQAIECIVRNNENKGQTATAFIDADSGRFRSNITLVRGSSGAVLSGAAVGVGIAIGLGVALALVLVLAIVVVIVLRRRRWMLPCADEDGRRKSQRSGSADSTSRRKQGLQLTLAGTARRRQSGSDTSLGEDPGPSADASNYDALRRRKGDSPEPYMSLGGPNTTHNLTSRSPYIDDAGPLYENRATVVETPKEFPVYANSYTDGTGFRL